LLIKPHNISNGSTINEIIGDALLVIFGAPQEMSDQVEKAIACSIEMQNAMSKVNKKNRSRNLPDLIDTDEDLISKDFYGKIVEKPERGGNGYLIRFTSTPPEITAYFQAYRKHASKETT
jgi:hypothetical protein